MRTILLFLFSFTVSEVTFGQQLAIDSGFTNKAEAKNQLVNGLKEGKWCEYSEFEKQGDGKQVSGMLVPTIDTVNATYYRLTIYKNGKPVGVSREYFMSGTLEGEVTYVDGKRTGYSHGYYPDGKLAFQIPFVEDKRNGVAKVFYQNGIVKSEVTYVDDKVTSTKNFKKNGKPVRVH